MQNENAKQRMEALVRKLNEASDAYYNDKDEILSNYEWDALFDELSALEQETGIVLPDSPTRKTGAEESFGNGAREAHEYPALSLAKSKDVGVLQKWAGDRPIWLSWKLDGITLVATYDNGKLSRLMTRGNGVTGTNITYLAKHIRGVPLTVAETGHLVVRGEATISYPAFEALNERTENDDEKYANPRNLVAGTLALDEDRAAEVAERGVCLNAFTLVHTDRKIVSWGKRMAFLRELGFITVDSEACTAETLPDVIGKWTERVRSGAMEIPVDGLVICFDDTEYAATGSVTGHHATNAGMAFKWQDTAADTVLDHVEWSCAAASITPVAVFAPVRLEGTDVRRASLCNLTEMKRLGIGADSVTKLKVIKSNMIIPKVIAADGCGTAFSVPETCPVCGAPTFIRTGSGTGSETLHCSNPDCTAKNIRKFERFVSRQCMDIDGLSIETISKFINAGVISDFVSFYHIAGHRDTIEQMDGFGPKSFQNIVAAVEKSRDAHPANLINALSIPKIGLDAGKRLIAKFGTAGFLEHLEKGEGFEAIDGFGAERSNSILTWYADARNREMFLRLIGELRLKELDPVSEDAGGRLKGLTFCITGDVHLFKNRDAFKAYVESQGGKVSGSVSSKTAFLVNNDAASTSSKNKKAAELGIPILTEEEFTARFGGPGSE
ncbi:MAG: NAD-dependent DNA ligase LigA [Clostridia bacterium]|nr:NAD-dependent DNA ligase LigA [Clostridia bacterium]